MWRTARLVAAKDLRIELRSRVLLWQVLPFGVIALVLCGLAVGPSAVATRRAAPGLFYLVTLLVALLVINRAQSVEAPIGTRTSIRMLGLDPGGVFVGKTIALFTELGVTSVVLLGGVMLLLHAPATGTLEAVPGIALALAAIAASGTMYGALVGDTRANVTLLPIIALPPFAGILVIGELAFNATLHGEASVKWVVVLGAILAAYLAMGILLYGVAEESA